MNPIQKLEKNIVLSFNLIKNDMHGLKNELQTLKVENKLMRETLEDLKENDTTLYEKIKKLQQKKKTTKRTVKKAKKKYVSAKAGKKFHLDICPYAQNIKPKNRVSFSSKNKALDTGLKPCNCIK